MQRVLLLLGAASIGASIAMAGATPPCSAGAAGENVLPVYQLGGVQTYCVSDFGWSDTWLLGTPATYNQNVDMLSGDDAFNLKYSTSGATNGGWLNPSIDAGNGTAQLIGTAWTVVNPVTYVGGTNQTTSTIQDGGGNVQVTIDTTVIGGNVTLSFTFTALAGGAGTGSGLQFADYFNFHPNGSTGGVGGGIASGTTSYAGGCISTQGTPGPNFLQNAQVCGSSLDNNHDVGLASPAGTPAGTPPGPIGSGSNQVWNDVQTSSYNNLAGPVGPADSAGALEWNLPGLRPGDSETFVVTKSLSIVTPEPGTLAMGVGAALLLLSLRRKKRGA